MLHGVIFSLSFSVELGPLAWPPTQHFDRRRAQ